MKRLLLSICAATSLTVGSLTAQDISINTDPTGHTRFWDFYTPNPSNYLGSSAWWQGDNLTGDWWGIRNAFDDKGVEFVFNYTTNLAGNPVGGMSQGFTYTDNIYFGVQLDMEKLVGWKGALITVSGLDRNGTSLSQQNIGNQFTVQQIYGGQTAMFYALFLEQKFWDDKADLKIGRFATGDDFASSPLYWLYMNNGIDGNPQGLPVNATFSAYPWAVWAARLKLTPTKETTAMVGLYQASNRIFNRNYHGTDWSIRGNDGVMLISQVGWNPEFFKREVPAEAATPKSDGKQVAIAGKTGKSFKQPVEAGEMKGLPGHYWFGAYYSTLQYQQYSGNQTTAGGSYGFYWHADQMVFQEGPGSDQGLTIWSAFLFSPQQNISKLPFQVNGGIVYKGLIPSRDDDFSIFGIVYGNFSNDYAADQNAAGLGNPSYEMVFEWAYRVQINKFIYAQPDVQWVVNPGGTGTIPNALVLGAQIGVTF